MPDALMTALAGLVGAVIGSLATLSADFLRHRREAKKEKGVIAAALAASIESNISLIDRREHTVFFEEALARLDVGQDVKFNDSMNMQPIEDPLAREIGIRVGVLGPDLARDALKFFYQLEGIRMDLKALGIGELDGDPDGKAAHIREDLLLWSETRSLGIQLVQTLRQPTV